MANNKQNKNSKTSKTQKQTSRAKSKKAQEAEELERQQKRESANRIIEIIIFSLSVIFFAVAVISGEGAWHFVHNVYVGLFGILGAIILPILVVVITVLYSVKDRDPKIFVAKGIESFFMVLFISALIHIIQNEPGAVFSTTVNDSFSSAAENFNGGLFGAVIGWALLSFGKAPAIIVDLVLVFVDFMLMTGITIIQFLKGAASPAKATYDKVAPVIEEKREQRRMSKEDIDVPLDENPPTDEDEQKSNKGKKKTDEAESTDDENPNKVPKTIIDEINEATARNIARRENKNPKSIDDIVRDASEDGAKDAEKFEVTNSQMTATVEDYVIPPISILKDVHHASTKDVSGELKANAEKLIDTLHSFNVDATITDISRGPTVTRYELKPAAGIRISKITNLADDIALNLAATHVRIEAPIPGKAAVGIEVPNSVKNMVSMREVVETQEFKNQKSKLSAGLGKDIAGNIVFCDIAKMPHLLIAGTTGSGKSVCMNSIIVSMLYRAKPNEVKFLMIDPKQVEFSKYSGIPHLLVPVVTDPRKAAGALGWAVSEMLQRYNKFSEAGVRDISGYNKYVKKHDDLEPMPKICIFIDELSDLMMAAPKEVEDSICRLAQMARAAGMHLIIATQRPSVDVITGLIKANISSRIALTVSSQVDSRTIIDSAGAEKLLGNGDMLYSPVGSTKPYRVQGCFVSDEEVENLCDYIKKQGQTEYDENIQKEIDEKAVTDKKGSPFEGKEEGNNYDALFEKAAEIVIESGTASTSFLQRKLSVGYARGAKIIDQLQEYGVIGPADGSKPRQVLMNKQMWLEKRAYESGTEFNLEQMTMDDNLFEGMDDTVTEGGAFGENFANDIIDNQTDDDEDF